MNVPGGKDIKLYAVVGESEASAVPYPYIYVNSDGTARELRQDEREYLETRFAPFDGDRPYVKGSYLKKNGWGEIRGFLRRSELPRDVVIGPAQNDSPDPQPIGEDIAQRLRDKGFEIVENSDGSFSARRQK